jgi:hypothetical protein
MGHVAVGPAILEDRIFERNDGRLRAAAPGDGGRLDGRLHVRFGVEGRIGECVEAHVGVEAGVGEETVRTSVWSDLGVREGGIPLMGEVAATRERGEEGEGEEGWETVGRHHSAVEGVNNFHATRFAAEQVGIFRNCWWPSNCGRRALARTSGS